MTFRCVLSTANPDKAAEIRAIFSELGGIELLERPTEIPDVEETGTTLVENARLKAVALSTATGLVAIADDTGLLVDALGGEPGVYSARYAGEDASYQDNCDKLLKELEGIENRHARFQTVAFVSFPDGHEFFVDGEVLGSIGGEARGEGGFGYDPLFIPEEGDGRSFAEMTAHEKQSLSHRARAFRALAEELRQRGLIDS